MYFTITSDQIVWVLAFVGSIYTIYKFYKEWKKPKEDLKEMVEEHEEKLASDDKRLKEIEKADKLILQSLLVIINHDITGNGINQLKETRDELNEYLINK